MINEVDVSEVLIPLLNPNEPEALLAGMHVHEGQHVAPGDLLCTLETTKAAAELSAERPGFIIGLRIKQGQTVQAGERLCYLASAPEWTPPKVEDQPISPMRAELPPDLRITKPALILAQSVNLDLAQFPEGLLVTEEIVRAHLENSRMFKDIPPDLTQIVVYGGGGHGKTVIEMIRAAGIYKVVAIIDDGIPSGNQIIGVPVQGGANHLPIFHSRGIRLAANAVGGIGKLPIRLKVFEHLAYAGFTCPTLVHPTAVIEPSAHLAEGIQVMPLAYVGSEARIDFGVIINTGAIVSHDCHVGEYSNLSPGAILAGEVIVGSSVLIGMGVTVNLRVKIGNRARIGNGATVKSDVPEGGIVRAGTIWPE